MAIAIDFPSRDLFFWLMMFFFVVIPFLGVTSFGTAVAYQINNEKGLSTDLANMPKIYLKYANPLAIAFWILYGGSLAMKVVGIELWRFSRLAFAYTHTDERKLCFVNGVIGTFVGAYFKNPMMGMVIGGGIGKLYYPLTRPVAERLRDKFAEERLTLAKK